MQETVIDAHNLSKIYDEKTIPVYALNKVHLHISRGEFTAIKGPSGSGKSTLLQIIGLLNPADSGSILLDNIECTTLNERELIAFRNRKMGFVFQFHNLLGEFTCEENIKMPLLIREKSLIEAQFELFDKIINKLSISDLIKKYPSQLSGGEQQRVAVARALINNPDIVFADEPTGNLDSTHAQELHELFLHLQKTMGQTFLIVTHNEALAKMSDRVIHMKDGYIA